MLGHGAATALRRHVLEDRRGVLKVGELAPDLGEVLQGHRPDLGAGPLAAVDQPEQVTDLLECEAELATAAMNVSRFRCSGA